MAKRSAKRLTSRELRKLMDQGVPVRFHPKFDDADTITHGYIMAIGPPFFLLAYISDDMRFDGFRCFQISEIRKLRPDPYHTFIEAALKKRKERKPKCPPIQLNTVADILRSANRAFPLVTIHCERVDPDVCWIGRVLDISQGYVSLLEIQPAAIWDAEPTSYRLSRITRVDFGGGYEEALYLVGGEPPGRKSSR
jgi:hypothetical protein